MEKKCPLSLKLVRTACKVKRKACFHLRDTKPCLLCLTGDLIVVKFVKESMEIISEYYTKCFIELFCYIQIK